MKNFKIENNGIVSEYFQKLNIYDFESAAHFIAHLSYRRNKDKTNIWCVFEEHAGTCSTKHAVLRKLALENHQKDFKLMLGIFKMDEIYAPSISETLKKYDLSYIPEAHNYLKIEDSYFDFTKPKAKYLDFSDSILFETEIEFDEINTKKVKIHKDFLAKWTSQNTKYNLEEIWKIREKCIEDLQTFR